MTLARFAWTVDGPRDAAINLVIHALIAWWAYHGREHQPLVPSVAWYLLPMSFVLPLVTTYLGYDNGVEGRKADRLTPPLAKDAAWRQQAALAGLLCGAISFGVTALVIFLWHSLVPAAEFSSRNVITGIALLAAGLDYLLHSRAVLCAARIS